MPSKLGMHEKDHSYMNRESFNDSNEFASFKINFLKQRFLKGSYYAVLKSIFGVTEYVDTL